MRQSEQQMAQLLATKLPTRPIVPTCRQISDCAKGQRARSFEVQGSRPAEPFSQRRRHKLRSVVRPNEHRWPMKLEEISHRLEYILGSQPSCRLDRKRFPRELVNHRQHSDLPAVVRLIGDKVIGPNVMAMARPKPDTRSVVEPQSSVFWQFHWNFEALAPPNAMHALVVHAPSKASQHRRDASIAVPSVLCRQSNHVARQRGFIQLRLGAPPLCGANLRDHAAGAAL